MEIFSYHLAAGSSRSKAAILQGETVVHQTSDPAPCSLSSTYPLVGSLSTTSERRIFEISTGAHEIGAHLR